MGREILIQLLLLKVGCYSRKYCTLNLYLPFVHQVVAIVDKLFLLLFWGGWVGIIDSLKMASVSVVCYK